MSQPVYINAIGKYLPGNAIRNEDIEKYLGLINDKPSRTKAKMLKQNGIQQRHYALNEQQETTESVSGMATKAINDCLQKSGIPKSEIQYLSTATTQGDIPVPGLASMVHAEAQLPVCEIASHQSVCASGIMAIKNAWNCVQLGQASNALVAAGELPSRMFKAKRFKHQKEVIKNDGLSLETDFLRWMLSDGAGAMLLSNIPAANNISFKIEWIDIRSYAHLFETCMYAGMNRNGSITADKTWMDYDSFTDADASGASNLKQDLRLVHNVITLGIQHFFNLIDTGKINPEQLDWLVCHYSSEHFKQPIKDLLQKGGLHIPEEKWFTNLHTKGNTGAASIFIMLEELLYEKELKDGQQIICMVPESGRFITTFMKLTVIKPTAQKAEPLISMSDAIIAPQINIHNKPVQEQLVRGLTSVWIDFETALRNTPIIQKIYNGTLTLEDYRLLLLNLRQQVIDGSQWIARAASNVSMDYFDIRSSFISHSRDEHKDYQILEENYVNCGGKREDLQKGEKNIGSEALSAFMFQRASQPNPFDLLGGMFIIEGLGNRIAGNWGRAIQHLLGLNNNQVSFFTYHETSDSNENHFERFEKALNSELLTDDMAKRILKTAKVVARLYQMQLAEVGNY